MEQPGSMSGSTEDLRSIEIVDVDSTRSSSTSSLHTHLTQTGDINGQPEQVERQQIDELNDINSIVTEREKYKNMYNCLQKRFLAFEQKQLDQMRRILNTLTPDQHAALSENSYDDRYHRRAFTSPSTPILLPSSLNQTWDDSNQPVDDSKTESDWEDLLRKISKLMDFSEKYATKLLAENEEKEKLRILYNQKQDENVKLHFDLSLLNAEYAKEQQIRCQFEKQCTEANQLIEQDRSKRLLKLQNYAALADEEGDIVLSGLIKKAEKNDTDLTDMKKQYESLFMEQVNHVKQLVKERELLHLYVQRLEAENRSLAAKTNDDETVRLLTYASESPTSLEEAAKLIDRLREQIVEQMKIRDKCQHEIKQLKHNYDVDLRQQEQAVQQLHRDLNAAKYDILILQNSQSDHENTLNLKIDLERQLEESATEIVTLKSVVQSITNQFKEKIEQLSSEKESLNDANAALRIQIQKLKVDFENSESVQHDFVKLTQALQVQLEEIRNAEHELRWQPEEDFSECQRCHKQFSVAWRKHRCRHCGKVLCKECVNKTVHTGPNDRASRVCEICYTLLVKNSQPYFFDSIPKV